MFTCSADPVGRRGGTRLAALSPAGVLSPRRSSEDSADDTFSIKDLRVRPQLIFFYHWHLFEVRAMYVYIPHCFCLHSFIWTFRTFFLRSSFTSPLNYSSSFTDLRHVCITLSWQISSTVEYNDIRKHPSLYDTVLRLNQWHSVVEFRRVVLNISRKSPGGFGTVKPSVNGSVLANRFAIVNHKLWIDYFRYSQ